MSSLPDSWCYAEIEHILQWLDTGKVIQQGWSPQCDKQAAALDEWGVLKTTAIQEGSFLPNENKKLPDQLEPRPAIEINPGDILMTCAGPRNRCGISCLVKETPKRLLMSGKMYRFRTFPQKIEAKYLEAFLLSQEAKFAIDKMKTGISDSGLNLTHSRFKTLVVPIPPTKEQRRIVAKVEELFSELDKGVESLQTARVQLKTYRQAVLKHAFEGKLTAKWREENKDKLEPADKLLARIEYERESRYQQRIEEWNQVVIVWKKAGQSGKKPTKPRKQPELKADFSEFAELATLPGDWRWVLLNQLTEHIVDGSHKTPKYTHRGIYFISAKDVKDFRIDFSNTRFIDSEQHAELIKRCQPRLGNILITKSGTLGRVAVVETNTEFSLFESVANIPTLPPINPKFLALSCFHIIDTYFGARKQKGVAVRHLHLEDLRRLPVPLPSSSEQIEIARRLEAIFSIIDNQEMMIDSEITRAEALRQSILKKAFSGQLVPQDPSDEPASVLLERIRVEKTAQANAKTKPKAKKKPKRKNAA